MELQDKAMKLQDKNQFGRGVFIERLTRFISMLNKKAGCIT